MIGQIISIGKCWELIGMCQRKFSMKLAIAIEMICYCFVVNKIRCET